MSQQRETADPSVGWSIPPDAPLTDLWALVEWRCARSPAATFVTTASGRTLTFRRYRDACADAASALSARGVGKGSVLAWQLPTDRDAVVLLGAAARLGAVQVPLLPSYRDRELTAVAGQTRPQLLVVPDNWRGYDHAALARRIQRAHPELAVSVLDEGLAVDDGASLAPPEGPGASAQWVFFTSGSTAEPKGVRHSDATLIAAALGTAEASAQRADDVYLLLTPIAHVGGVIAIAAALLTGCRCVLVPALDPAALGELVARERVTLAAAPLPVQRAFLDSHRADPGRQLFASVRAYPIGGAPTPPDLHRQIRQELGGIGLLAGYGLTECPIATKNQVGDPDEKLATTEGRPTRGVDVRIVPVEAGAGAEGEIRLRGPQLFCGYVDSSLDAVAFDEQGYLRTGDLGRLDAEGFLTVTGRLKDVIIRKGENISAAEVEHVVRRHPLVADVAVIGVPDEDLGERCCAVVELVDPSGTLSLDNVTTFLETQGLMRQKFPERLEVLSALPRNAFGKADKQALRARLAEGS